MALWLAQGYSASALPTVDRAQQDNRATVGRSDTETLHMQLGSIHRTLPLENAPCAPSHREIRRQPRKATPCQADGSLNKLETILYGER